SRFYDYGQSDYLFAYKYEILRTGCHSNGYNRVRVIMKKSEDGVYLIKKSHISIHDKLKAECQRIL
ncbi:hypothetical protein, partial [uncultured Bacteroides sp.]|uniref:hypothetical protein n=1 Tax=uncultured Bacteroides sp. TaxID=162156 RepID=UPI002632211F